MALLATVAVPTLRSLRLADQQTNQVRALEALLKQADGPQRAEAFLALGKLRDPRAEQALIKGLLDPDWQVRMNAAMALGPLGGQAAIAPLGALLEGLDPAGRRRLDAAVDELLERLAAACASGSGRADRAGRRG